METIIWIVVAIIWLAFSAINNNKKKQQKAQQQQKPTPDEEEMEETKEEMPTLKEIIRDFQRQIQETQTPTIEEAPKPVIIPPVKRWGHEVSNKQILVEDREVISEKEKRTSIEYEKFVAEERKKEHDAEQRNLEAKIFEVNVAEEYEAIDINLDLKNIIIADVIMRRPEY
ncbi:MAG: hypothetical protein H7X71_00815 [Chitinophagales bacterium]|nr:hypothetical protein [Chitinophagales bacterium]